MSFYSGAPFFGTLILLLLFALILGCMEKSLRWYNLIVSGVMVVCVLGGNLTALAYFAGYFLIEWMLVRGHKKEIWKKGSILSQFCAAFHPAACIM